MSTPPQQTPPDGGPGGTRLLSALLTILALAPVGAVGGVLVSYKFGGDTTLYALCGGFLGTLAAMLSRSK